MNLEKIKSKQLNIIFRVILITAFSVVSLIPFETAAQEKNEEVTIIAPYNPTVTSAAKINRNPRVVFAEPRPLPEISYKIQTIRSNTSIAPDSPKPVRVAGDPKKDLYRSHVRAGFGNYLTPYFELWVNSLQSDEFSAGAHIAHLSSFGEIKDYAKSSFSNTGVDAYAKKYFNNNSLGGKIFYSNRMVHRYGFRPADFPELTIDEEDLKQSFNKAGMEILLQGNKTDKDAFNYNVGFSGYYLFDRYESDETGLFADAGLSKGIDMFNNRRAQQLGLDLSLDYYLNNDSVSDYHGGIVSAKPFLNMDLKPYRIYVGVRFDYVMDTDAKLHFYPLIKAEASLIENALVLYALVDGSSERISYAMLTEENPFVNTVLPLNYSSTYAFSGGLKGRIREVFDYNAGISYKLIDNMFMYVNDTSNILRNSFDVVFDDVGVFSAYGELGFRVRSDLGIFLSGAYHTYSMDQEEKAWHKPALELSLNSYYIIKESLTLTAGLRSNHGTYARIFTNNEVKAQQIDTWFDLNLGAKYRINKQFSAFIKLNNLLNEGYFKWYQYPVYKFNVLAGVGFSF